MRLLRRKKWYWIGIGCHVGEVRGPYESEKQARKNTPVSPQFRLSRRYPGE